jgi:peptidoglycan/xylan/chitin deacetylase (PgdA/CDA1 family)
VLPLAVAFKVDKFLINKQSKNHCIINFHGVRTTAESFNNRHIPVKEFEKIIRYLSKNFECVHLSALFDVHRNKTKSNKRSIALTFDDGYRNNFEVALPVLKKYGVPATYYIISKGLTDPAFVVWPDVIDIIKKYCREDIIINKMTFKYPHFHCLELGKELLEYLKTQGSAAEELVKELATRYNFVSRELARLPQLVKLVDAPMLSDFKSEPLIEYGSHSHSHFNMEFLSETVALQELEKSKQIIESTIEKQIISFAYPDGSYTKQTNELAIKSNYNNIVVVDYKYGEKNKESHLLSRFTISNSTTFESNVLRLAREFDKYGF